ncbi:hypothetical protein CASFOL_035647 [Castilleja foliolosa]|uniref:Peptidase S59 domain-containing protein n=1 Tax=Castilleja foliolosa TaxID=1961234 RepID=A0ABD3BTG5_9LAMI
MVIATPWSSNTRFGQITEPAPSSQSSFGFPTSSGTGTVFGVPNTPKIDFKSTPGFGFNSSNAATASTNSSIFGVRNPSTGFTTGTSHAFPSTTSGFVINSNSANASTSSVFGVPNPSGFATGFSTGTSHAFPSTTSGFGINSNSANASTSSVFGVPNPSGFATGFTTGTSYVFPSTTSGFGINSTNIFGIKSLTESPGMMKLKPTTGSRLSPYSATRVVVEVSGKKCTEKLQSISAMPVYETKSHEELRLEDYELLRNKGDGPKNCDTQRSPFEPVKPNNNPFSVSNNNTTSSTFFPSPSPISGNSTSELVQPQPFNAKPNPFSLPNTNPSPYQPQPTKPNPFSLPSPNPSPFQPQGPQPFNANPNPFSLPNPNPSPNQPQPFNSNPNPFSFPNPSPSPIQPQTFNSNPNPFSFPNPNPSPYQPQPANTNPFSLPNHDAAYVAPSPFQPQPAKPNPFSLPNHNTSPFQPQPAKPNPFSIPNHNPSPSQPQPFNSNPNPFPSPTNTCDQFPTEIPTAFTNSKLTSTVSPSTQSTTSVSATAPWPSTLNTSQPAEITGSVFINNPAQPSEATSGSKEGNEVGYPYNNGQQQQQYVPASTVGAQSSLVADPFPKQSEIVRPNTVLVSVRHGISSLPAQVPNKLPSNRREIRIRHVSSRLNSLPPHKRYSTPSSEPKVAFFHNEVERPCPFLPRENPRAWVTIYSSTERKCCKDKDLPSSSSQLNTFIQEETEHLSAISISYQNDKEDSVIIAKKHETNILPLMPKLPNENGYYSEPSLDELAAKEMDEPGSLSHVNDFVVGKSGCGSIKFIGETDIRHLDIGSVVQFNNREVIVYADEETKPDVGKGMNKPAEITLLNVKCLSKKTGKQYVDGPQVQRYEEMLMKKASEQGAEFVSYDPVRGEWKFRVQHF